MSSTSTEEYQWKLGSRISEYRFANAFLSFYQSAKESNNPMFNYPIKTAEQTLKWVASHQRLVDNDKAGKFIDEFSCHQLHRFEANFLEPFQLNIVEPVKSEGIAGIAGLATSTFKEKVVQPVTTTVRERVVEPVTTTVRERVVEPVTTTVREKMVEPVTSTVRERFVEPIRDRVMVPISLRFNTTFDSIEGYLHQHHHRGEDKEPTEITLENEKQEPMEGSILRLQHLTSIVSQTLKEKALQSQQQLGIYLNFAKSHMPFSVQPQQTEPTDKLKPNGSKLLDPLLTRLRRTQQKLESTLRNSIINLESEPVVQLLQKRILLPLHQSPVTGPTYDYLCEKFDHFLHRSNHQEHTSEVRHINEEEIVFPNSSHNAVLLQTQQQQQEQQNNSLLQQEHNYKQLFTPIPNETNSTESEERLDPFQGSSEDQQ